MKNGMGKMGFLRYAKERKAAALAIGTVVVLAGCVTRPAIDTWDDASLAAEQRLVIEQQQKRLDDMGNAVQRIQEGITRAIDEVTASLNGTGDLENLFGEIDLFVRRIIESKRELESLQRTASGTDATAG